MQCFLPSLHKACSEHTKAYKCFAENLQTDDRKQAFSVCPPTVAKKVKWTFNTSGPRKGTEEAFQRGYHLYYCELVLVNNRIENSTVFPAIINLPCIMEEHRRLKDQELSDARSLWNVRPPCMSVPTHAHQKCSACSAKGAHFN
ncbi:hypothetical protein PROFUN_15209 [Planoprotostelium fungivorum]|uniref:Uncharacterized protein n=1 Tax=Planoprotostelium fungivorum TaxID=1890364 RepID=A0A2P6MWY3_9EUKA|nr:hypothetical protein PROFUN_15209 [Planoprotostelium fungivorum]